MKWIWTNDCLGSNVFGQIHSLFVKFIILVLLGLLCVTMLLVANAILAHFKGVVLKRMTESWIYVSIKSPQKKEVGTG